MEQHIQRKPTRLGKVVRKVLTNNHRERFHGHRRCNQPTGKTRSSIPYGRTNGSEKKCFSHKNPGKRILDINFAEFWELLKTTFTVTTNLAYERFKLFGQRQKENESLEKFHETLPELAKNCKLGELEPELVRDIFITNMRNVEIQKKLCIEYLTPENVLSYVLVHEKYTKNHQIQISTKNSLPIMRYKDHNT